MFDHLAKSLRAVRGSLGSSNKATVFRGDLANSLPHSMAPVARVSRDIFDRRPLFLYGLEGRDALVAREDGVGANGEEKDEEIVILRQDATNWGSLPRRADDSIAQNRLDIPRGPNRKKLRDTLHDVPHADCPVLHELRRPTKQ